MSRRRAAALGLACLLLLAGCSVAGDPTGQGAGTASPTLTPAPVPSETPTPRGTPAPPAPLRPGATPGPGIDAWSLAGQHAETLQGRSYTWSLRRETRVYHGGPPTTTRMTLLTARVADATTYRVDRLARTDNGSWRNGTVAYADGSRLHRLRSNGTAVTEPAERRRGGEGVVADRSESVIARYLAARRVSVVQYPGEGRRYLLRGRGAPPRSENVSGYRVAALVESDGRVTALRAAWREPNRFVEVRYRYRAVGNTTVSSPAWYDDREAVARSTASAATTETPGATTTVSTPTPNASSGPGLDTVNVSTGEGGVERSPADGRSDSGVWDWPAWTSQRALKERPGDDSPGFGY